MSNASSAKGNPASHRMSNASLKAKRARSYNLAQDRNKRNAAENAKRAEANKARGNEVTLTLWASGQLPDRYRFTSLSKREADRLVRFGVKPELLGGENGYRNLRYMRSTTDV